MKLVEIKENFKINAGAPMPQIMCNEHRLFLTFYVGNKDDIVTVSFENFIQFKFGNPNDEAIDGHKYYELGLQPYRIQEIIDSDWINDLREMNSVHPYHNDSQFYNLRHFIFFFHDTCFEVVANGYQIDNKALKTMKEELKRLASL